MIGLNFQHKLIHQGNLAESEQVHRGKLSVIRQQMEKETTKVYVSVH